MLDVCAAPGGKTAQLLCGGANVTAIDISNVRIRRLKENLDRLGLKAELIHADIKSGLQVDYLILFLDAPCSATGTIRRNPDVLIHKTYEDVQKLSIVQMEILQKVSKLVRPGGQLVYCTCSLQYEEGEAQVDRFLSKNTGFRRDPISLHEIGSFSDAINVNGICDYCLIIWTKMKVSMVSLRLDLQESDGIFLILLSRYCDYFYKLIVDNLWKIIF